MLREKNCGVQNELPHARRCCWLSPLSVKWKFRIKRLLLVLQVGARKEEKWKERRVEEQAGMLHRVFTANYRKSDEFSTVLTSYYDYLPVIFCHPHRAHLFYQSFLLCSLLFCLLSPFNGLCLQVFTDLKDFSSLLARGRRKRTSGNWNFKKKGFENLKAKSEEN